MNRQMHSKKRKYTKNTITTRGYSLGQDLKILVNNPKHSDVEILCKDGITLHGNCAILSARSDVFDSLLNNGLKGRSIKISFPKIDSTGMEITLEYIYTGTIKDSLTKDNIVEAYISANYFQLLDLQDMITTAVKNNLEKNYKDNYSPELLSKIVDLMDTSEDNLFLNLLVETVSTTPLDTIEFGRLSATALRHLLTCNYGKEKVFASEYEILRYSAILVARQISYDATKILLKRLPIVEKVDESKQIDDELIPDHQKVAEELVPLIKFIDFRRINGQILTDIIEPLKLIPDEFIINAYRHKARSNNTDLGVIREVPPSSLCMNKSLYVWDESVCGSKLIIEDNGKVVRAKNGCNSHQSVRAKIALENKGNFEWDVIIEKRCALAWVGVCTTENFDHEKFAGYNSGWMLGTSGSILHSVIGAIYCPPFEEDNSKVTVHLDMNKRTCAFTVNGVKHSIVSNWKLPSKLYPVVSLRFPGQLRIQLH